MGDATGISWTEATWNPWMGCTKVSEGCDHCYMFREQRQYGNDPELVRRSKTKFNEPLKWEQGRLVFTCSWSDWFHVDADLWRDEAWDVIRRTPQHTYQILTKRPGRILRHLPEDWGDGYPNVWLGVSVESAAFLNRVDALRQVPAALRFISAEPLLGSLFPPLSEPSGSGVTGNPGSCHANDTDGRLAERPTQDSRPLDRSAPAGKAAADDATEGGPAPRAGLPLDLTGIGWVIVGGESGGRQTSRPMHPRWVREILEACAGDHWCNCNIPILEGAGQHSPGCRVFSRPLFHFKQWGSWGVDLHGSDPNAVFLLADGAGYTAFAADAYGIDLDGAYRMGYKGPKPTSGGKDLDGVEWCEIPPVLAPA